MNIPTIVSSSSSGLVGSWFEHFFDFALEEIKLLEVVFGLFGFRHEDRKGLHLSEFFEPDFESLLSFVVSILSQNMSDNGCILEILFAALEFIDNLLCSSRLSTSKVPRGHLSVAGFLLFGELLRYQGDESLGILALGLVLEIVMNLHVSVDQESLSDRIASNILSSNLEFQVVLKREQNILQLSALRIGIIECLVLSLEIISKSFNQEIFKLLAESSINVHDVQRVNNGLCFVAWNSERKIGIDPSGIQREPSFLLDPPLVWKALVQVFVQFLLIRNSTLILEKRRQFAQSWLIYMSESLSAHLAILANGRPNHACFELDLVKFKIEQSIVLTDFKEIVNCLLLRS